MAFCNTCLHLLYSASEKLATETLLPNTLTTSFLVCVHYQTYSRTELVLLKV